MAADLFETYAVTAIAAMLLGSLLFPGDETKIILPLLIGSVAICASIVGSFAVRIQEHTRNIMGGLYRGLLASSALSVLMLWPGFAPVLWRGGGELYFFV